MISGKTYGKILIIVGELLLLIGIVFCILRWPDIFKGLLIGPGFIVVGLVLEILGIRKL